MVTMNAEDNTRSQMIVLAGLLLALIVISAATVIGSAYYSQSTPDDRGLQAMQERVTGQSQATQAVGEQVIEHSSEEVEQTQGNTTDELEEFFENQIEEYTELVQQLPDDAVILEVEFLEALKMSWLVGQDDADVIPGVETDVGEQQDLEGESSVKLDYELSLPADVVFSIDTTGSMGVVYSTRDPGDVRHPYTEETSLLGDSHYDEHPYVADSTFSTASLLSEGWHRVDDPLADPGDRASYCDPDVVDAGTRLPVGHGYGTSDNWCEGRTAGFNDTVYDPSETQVVVDNAAGRLAQIISYNPAQDLYDISYDGTGQPDRSAPASDLQLLEYRWWVADRMYNTQVETKRTIGMLGDHDRVGLVEYNMDFSGDANTLHGVNQLTPNHRQGLNQSVDDLVSTHGTNIAAGVEEAHDVLVDGRGGTVTDPTEEFVAELPGGIEIRIPVDSVTVDVDDDNQVSDVDVEMGGKEYVGSAPTGEDWDKFLQMHFEEDYDQLTDQQIDDAIQELDEDYPGALPVDETTLEQEIESTLDEKDGVRSEHLIVHTDGFNTEEEFDKMAVDNAMDAAEENVSVHTLAMGTAANTELMDRIASNGEEVPETDPPGIFEDSDPENVNEALQSIVNVTEGDGAAADFDVEIDPVGNVSREAGGQAEELYLKRMAVTGFESDGSLVLEVDDVDEDGETQGSLWRMNVTNTTDPGYTVRVTSDSEYKDLDRMETRDTDLDVADPEDGVRFDFFVGDDGVLAIEGDHYNDTLSLDTVRQHYPVSVNVSNAGGNASGVFRYDLQPSNFSDFEDPDDPQFEIEGCGDHRADDVTVCGTATSEGEAYSTAQIRRAKLRVTIETPEGVDEREVVVDLT